MNGTPRDPPVRPSKAAMAVRITLTPEQQKMLDEFNRNIAQALAANLNTNVLNEQAGDAAVAAFRRFMAATLDPRGSA